MSSNDDGVLEAARAIRPYLADLIGPDAAELDSRLARELADTSNWSQTVGRVRTLLSEHDDTAWFLAEVLRDEPDFRPPYYQPRFNRTAGDHSTPAGLAGNEGLILAARYVCPKNGDYIWYQPDIGADIPECPTDRVTLIRG